MEKKNTVDEVSYVLDHIYWMLLMMILYKNLLLRCVDGFTFAASKALLWGLLIVCSVTGICLAMKKRRNWKSMAQNMIIPFGIYTVITYLKINTEFIQKILIAAGIVSAVYAVMVFLPKIKSKRRRKRILIRRTLKACRGVVNVFTIAFAVILGVMGGGRILGSTVMQAAESKVNAGEEDTLENHKEELSKLKEEIWETLTIQEKLNVLQILVRVEKNYLGISQELNVGVANLEEGLLGCYKDNTHEIVLNLDVVMTESPWKVVHTVCHEVYHCFQYRIVEVYQNAEEQDKELRLFDSAKVYESEFANYIDGHEDLYGYAAQECEQDATSHADAALYEYYTRIVGE